LVEAKKSAPVTVYACAVRTVGRDDGDQVGHPAGEEHAGDEDADAHADRQVRGGQHDDDGDDHDGRLAEGHAAQRAQAVPDPTAT
jgi:hypothetical protein